MASRTTSTRRRGPALLWVQENLFSTWLNTLFTLIFGGLFLFAGVALVRFFLHAQFQIIVTNLTLFMVGRFPRELLWRVWVSNSLIVAAIGLAAGASRGSAKAGLEEAGLPVGGSRPREVVQRFWPILLLILVLLSLSRTWVPTGLTIVMGVTGLGAFACGVVLPASRRNWSFFVAVLMLVSAFAVLVVLGGKGWDSWGGLHLTVVVSALGILFAFPLGVLFAVGRRSSLPAIRFLSVWYIEFVRGVPLITLLLMGMFALRFLLPRGLNPGSVTRVLIAITLFSGAYVAENVRGGLQAVPKGQMEAALALGMGTWTTQRRIVLPQALRAVIPALVGQFISLFKDTSLLSIVGILELLSVSKIVNAQPSFFGQGLASVTLPFVGLIYWVGSYTMSRESRRIEGRLGVGER